jgi:hemin uptake protein HemP
MTEKVDHSTAPPQEPVAITVREVKAEELFQGCREVVIIHNNERYRLRITRREKLILQK